MLKIFLTKSTSTYSALHLKFKELTAELKSMDDVLPRPTPDAQLELLRRITEQASNDTVDEEFDVA